MSSVTVQGWTEYDDAQLKALHGTMTVQEIADAMGRSHGSIRSRITTLGIATRRLWTADEEEEVRRAYDAAGSDGVLDMSALVAVLGRSKANICRKARQMGLETNCRRRRVEERKERKPKHETEEARRKSIAAGVRAYISKHGHPRGMAGKSHTQDTKDALAASGAAWWASLPDTEKDQHTEKALRAKVAKHGCVAPNVARGSWKAAWREIGGSRIYFRSRWEANYARYLEWLRCKGEIAAWEHEPETFWFESIRRGVRSYLPDFLVTETNGTQAYHEVKGWMDSRSKTTIRRFRKFYPQHTLIVVDGTAYRAIERKASPLIGGWE